MTEKKLHVALLFGGNSSEHDVSKRSAHNIYDGMDKDKYDVSIFMFTKDGILLDNEASQRIFDGEPEDQVVQEAYQKACSVSSRSRTLAQGSRLRLCPLIRTSPSGS